MQMIDPTPITTFLIFASAVLAVGLVATIAGLTLVLRETRHDRQQRHESIPAYYGRLHFAH
jgi:hypothetical protein